MELSMGNGLRWQTGNKYCQQKLFSERILLKRNSSIFPLTLSQNYKVRIPRFIFIWWLGSISFSIFEKIYEFYTYTVVKRAVVRKRESSIIMQDEATLFAERPLQLVLVHVFQSNSVCHLFSSFLWKSRCIS